MCQQKEETDNERKEKRDREKREKQNSIRSNTILTSAATDHSLSPLLSLFSLSKKTSTEQSPEEEVEEETLKTKDQLNSTQLNSATLHILPHNSNSFFIFSLSNHCFSLRFQLGRSRWVQLTLFLPSHGSLILFT